MSGAFVFTGEDGSMGLKRGEVYILLLQSSGFDGTIAAQIANEKIGSYPIWRCPYEGWGKFRENWAPVA